METASGYPLTFHVIALAIHLNAFLNLFSLKMPLESMYGGHFQYLTTLGLALSTLTFFLASAADLRAKHTSRDDSMAKILQAIKVSIASVAAPAEMLITVLYAGLRYISRDLVMPDWARLPFMLDLSLHLMPTVIHLADTAMLSPILIRSPVQNLGVGSVLAGAYWIWVEKCHDVNGVYPYPIFDQAGLLGRILLFAFSAILLAINSTLLKWLAHQVPRPVTKA